MLSWFRWDLHDFAHVYIIFRQKNETKVTKIVKKKLYINSQMYSTVLIIIVLYLLKM